MDALTSRVISFLRFPLIVAVIFIHCNLLVKNPELESMPVFYFLVYITMKLVCIAVPLFFFISGLLFFKEGFFDWTLYKKKLNSRVHTLADDQRACLVGAFWFLQCLFVLFLLSPVIYYLIKYIRHFILIIIGILYFTDYIPEMPGIQCNAIVYYMFGAYLSIIGVDFISILKRIPVQAYIVVLIGAILVSYFLNENNIFYNITDLFIQAAVFAITVYMIENNRWKESQYLVSSVFFVFAVHRLFSAALMTISCYIIKSIGNEVFLYLYYLLMVLLTIIASLGVYQTSKRYLPRITNILNGGR